MTRSTKALINTGSSILYVIIATICGIIIPKLLIMTFGSEVYGATASITQFLAYISLLEAGIGGVARAALYTPLAEKNTFEINRVLAAIKHFYKTIAGIYVIYVLIIALTYNNIANNVTLNRSVTFTLTVVISISVIAQYYFGISYSTLVNADQKNYVNSLINILTTVLNAIFTYILVKLNYSIIVIKLASSLIFLLRPFILQLFVKKNYSITQKKYDKLDNVLTQKWNAFGQHIAFFLHSNIDIVVVTICLGLKEVAVYSVYSLVVVSLQKIVISFGDGMEAAFGNMIAKNETKSLNENFNIMELINSSLVIIAFTTASVMLIPFIKVYTNGITDVNYINPIFGQAFLLAEAIYCIRQPYHKVVIAAGHFRQTTMAAWIEAALNFIISLTLAWVIGIIGVAIGTLVAMTYKTIYNAIYLSKEIFRRDIILFIRRQIVTCINAVIILVVCNSLNYDQVITNYQSFFGYGFLTLIISAILTTIIDLLFYKREFFILIKKMKSIFRRSGITNI